MSMQIDVGYYDDRDDRDNHDNCDNRDNERMSLARPHNIEKEHYLTIDEFNYTMKILDEKINSLYKLCRHMSEQQQKDTQIIQRLAMADELSDEFWNVSYFNIFSNVCLIQDT
jgi:hypothetical protein